jgi:hypothetical protein
LLEAGSAFEREILASATLDVGSDRSFARTAAALGVGVTAAAATTASAGAATSGAAGSVGPTASTSAAGFAKWIVIAVAVAGATGAVEATRAWSSTAVRDVASTHAEPRRGPARGPAPASAPEAPEVPLGAALSAAPSSASPSGAARNVPSSAGSIEPAPIAGSRTLGGPRPAAFAIAPRAITDDPGRTAVQTTASSTAPNAPRSIAPSAPSSTLTAEVEVLDRVRRALARGDGRSALRDLDVYAQSFAQPVLGAEAYVLRVDALLEEGERAKAVALSREFLEANPASPHAPHLRSVIEQNP